jgi:hypothetical protein
VFFGHLLLCQFSNLSSDIFYHYFFTYSCDFSPNFENLVSTKIFFYLLNPEYKLRQISVYILCYSESFLPIVEFFFLLLCLTFEKFRSDYVNMNRRQKREQSLNIEKKVEQRGIIQVQV